MKIVHYINQFFGQIGGEEMADHPYEVREAIVGPGMMLKSLLSEGNEIVATIICGDNYFSDNTEEVEEKLKETLKKYEADLVVAGPAFNAGRYGMACGHVCQVAHKMGIKTVSGMFEENPGVELYRKYAYIFPTENNARGMKNALTKMAGFINKLESFDAPEANNFEEYDYKKHGYLQRGLRKNVWTEHVGAHRAVDMALAKVNGTPFETELPMPKFSRVKPSEPIADLSKAKIALLSTCGPVPTGNPDRIEAHAATKWRIYKVEDFGGEEMLETDIAHGGYTPSFGTKNGNRVMPVDAMLRLEREGFIGELDKNIYVTVGNSMPVTRAAEFGKEIAQSLKDSNVQGAILTSA